MMRLAGGFQEVGALAIGNENAHLYGSGIESVLSGQNHLDGNVWSAAQLQGKAEGEKVSLRKCIRPVTEISSPGHDELRACLSL